MATNNALEPGDGGPIGVAGQDGAEVQMGPRTNEAAPAENSLGADPLPPPPPPSDMMQYFSALQDHAAARYQRVRQVEANLELVRKELDGLVALGDLVSQDDLTAAATQLVSAGLGAAAVAGVLADAPDGGAALQGWLAQKDLEIRGKEQQMEAAVALTRHEMMLASLRHIIAHSAEGQAAGQFSGAAGPAPGLEMNNEMELPNAG